MPSIPKLLEIQDLDLAADELQKRRRSLPERAELERNLQDAAALDQSLEELERQSGVVREDERTLGLEVAEVAGKAKEVEDTLYSGSVKSPKELEGLQEEVRLLRKKQSALEDRELELMEQIEQIESDVRDNREQRSASDAHRQKLEASIAAAEGEIDGELAVIGGSRAAAALGIPGVVLEKYDELRTKDRLRGRAAGRLQDGSCQSCGVKLPVLENHRIMSEPPDALVRCTHCNRILVR